MSDQLQSRLRIANCGLRIPFFNPKSEIRNPKSALLTLTIAITALTQSPAFATEPDPAVLAAESARVETITRISRPTIAIFDPNGQGGGSGVIISTDGYALTNFHVAGGTGEPPAAAAELARPIRPTSSHNHEPG